MANILEQLDAQIATLLAEWSLLTTALALAVTGLLLYPILFPVEPDTHPLLLARQANINLVRNKNESAIYRSPEVPNGAPLRSGLNVKQAGAPRWATGKDGDLRDIWLEVQKGGTTGSDGKEIPSGAILTVLGVDAVEHDVEQLSREIQTIGKHFRESGNRRVAIYLPNSVEYLLAVFACSFYNLTPVLLPYNEPPTSLYNLINTTAANGLICAAGSLPLDDIATHCKNIRQLTWVVEKSSRHMDWNGVPASAADRLTVNVWHDLVQETSSTPLSLPTDDPNKPAEILTIWQNKATQNSPEVIPFSHSNFVAGISALLSAIPLRQRFGADDLFLPAAPLHIPYTLCQTLGALWSHASVALTSVAETGVDLALATRGIAPTIILASAETIANLYVRETEQTNGLLQRIGRHAHSQSLAAGRMPTSGLLFKLIAPSTSASGNKPGKLRLILTSERIGAGTPPLTSAMLSDLRIFTRARICYALTASKVAGAVAQTHVYDYRRTPDSAGYSHFGIALSSVEVKLVSREKGGDKFVEGARPQGEIVVSGPAVLGGGEVALGVTGVFGEDGTLGLA